MIQAEDANTLKLSETVTGYLEEFQDKETRHIYVDEFINAKIATQIKVLREQKGWTQAELADRAGMKQARISVLEDVNYDAWTLQTLRKLAEAFDLRINVSFEDFGSFLKEFSEFGRAKLERTAFEQDPIFKKGKPIGKVLRSNKFPSKVRIEQDSSDIFTLPGLIFEVSTSCAPATKSTSAESAATTSAAAIVSSTTTRATVRRTA